MSGYMPFSLVAPRLSTGRPATPIVSRALVQPRSLPELTPKPQPEPCDTKRKPLTPETVARIRALRAEGISARKIAKEVGCSHWVVLKLTRDIPPPPGGWSNGSRQSRFSKTFAQRLYRSGFSIPEIQHELGCGCTTARNLVHGRTRSTRTLRTPTSRVVEAVAEVFVISRREIRKTPGGKRRKSDRIEQARAITFWLLRRNGASFPSIGKSLGGYDHSTIINGCRRVDLVVAANEIAVDKYPGRAARQLMNVEWPSARGKIEP